ncbi:MAG: right-handed parallel beta-helix repeat-containing protein, partial [Gemmataceae bacterium]|nr:right-handed parallel beta-helix repeat-containing protein [Gemmataceae bacterium]
MRNRILANSRSRLLLDRLDERLVPALFTVQTTADSGVGSLRDLIALANLQVGADTIDFKAGLGGQIKLTSGELSITDALTITFPNVNNLDINGNNNGRVFNTSGAPAKTAITFSGFQIRDGNVTGKGGGILIGDESVTISNCSVISNNASDNGGGICILSANGSLKMMNSGVFYNNVPAGKSGGGIQVDTGSSVIIQNTTIRSNSAGINGGGINFDNGGTLLLENSTLAANTADNQGAGFRCFGAGNLTVRGSTLAGNSSGGTGGAIVLVGFTGALNVQNSTITGNLASAGSGGGIGHGSGTGVISITSSVVAGNTNALAPDISSVNPVSVNYCAISSPTGFTQNGGNNLAFGINLKLNTLADYGGVTETMRPASDSPLINKGANSLGLATDQRGVSRVIGSAADIGAVETCYSQIVTTTGDSGPGSLRQAVLDANIDADTSGITFDPAVFAGATTVTLTGGEIPVTESVSITGQGANLTTLSGFNPNRLFAITGTTTLTLTGLTVCQGSGGNGGAINVGVGGSVALNSCTVRDNHASFGGAIYFANGAGTSSLTATATTFSNNSSSFGGGAISMGSQMNATLKNCTLSGNSAATNGGAISLLSFTGTLQIQNCTITKNTASGSGGGGGITQSLGNGTVSIDSSIVSGNVGSVAPDIGSSLPVNVNWSAIGSTNGFSIVGTNNLPIASDLKLGQLADNGGTTKTHMPAFDSPLVHQGSNPSALLADQRGFGRIYGPGIDIGAVEVQYTSVVAIVRAGPSPTAAGSVSWTVTFVDPLANLSTGNFALTGPGAAGAFVSSVSGASTTWTVTATTGAEGLLGLSMINAIGLTHQITNLPAAGGAFAIDKLPLTTSVAASQTVLNASKVGAGTLTLTATYSEPMDPQSIPTFSFPVENPGAGLQFASGSWLTLTTYAAKYDLIDFDDEVANIDVRVSGGKDQAGNTLSFKDAVDVFSIDTANPVVLAMSRVEP